MCDLDKLIENGFFVSNVSNNRENIADYSLLGSLKSYFSTAEDLGWYMAYKDNNIEMKDLLLGAYAIDACNAITQFQHFFELFLKDILLEYDKLLVYDASKKPKLFIKMIANEKVSDSELKGLHLVKCSDAIERVMALEKTGKLNPEYSFIKGYFDLFKKLNYLRNQIAHRGAFIINPSALDEIFGKYVIPFVNKLDEVSKYGYIKSIAFNLENQNLNPFYAIAEEYNSSKVNENKIHLYKLIGAASYRNKIDFHQNEYFMDGEYCDNEKIRKQAEDSAKILAESSMVDAVVCPVCGCKSFVRELDSYDDVDGFFENEISVQYVSKINCVQCGFHIENWLLEKMKDMEIAMDDYCRLV